MSVHGAIDALNLRILRVDQIVLIRRVCSVAVPKPELDGRQFQGFTGEHISWPGTSIARPDDRINTISLVDRGFDADWQRIRLSACRVVATGPVHLDRPEPALRQVRL